MKRFDWLPIVAAGAAALSGADATRGQSFNIDVGGTFGVPTMSAPGSGVPTPGYGAAANQPGVWNALAGGIPGPVPLVNLAGGPTAATFTNVSALPEASFDSPLTTGNNHALLDDLLDFTGTIAASNFTFTGLAPGTYDVYTYVWNPAVPAAVPPGVIVFVQPPVTPHLTVPIAGAAWPGTLPGVTCLRATVSITVGQVIRVNVPPGGNSIGGFQLIHREGKNPLVIKLDNGISGDGSLLVHTDTFGAVTNPDFAVTPAVANYTASGPVPIPDAGVGACATSPPGAPATLDVVVPESITISKVTVGVYIKHTNQGDLKFTLEKVGSGTSVTLVDRPGSPAAAPTCGFAADNYGASNAALFRLDDAAAITYDTPGVVAPGMMGVSGNWKPESPLSAFNGMNSAGTWRLSVVDNANAVVGTIEFLSLTIRGTYHDPDFINHDSYNPAGAVGVVNPTFESALFIYKPPFGRTPLATRGHDLDTFYPSSVAAGPPVVQTSLDITTPLTGSDSDGDGIIDTAYSEFTLMVAPAGPWLDFELCQRVYKPHAGSAVARFRQTYTIGVNPTPLLPGMTFTAVRHHDMDLYMGNAEFTDVAGSIASSGWCATPPAGMPFGPPINPYQREPAPEPAATPHAIALVPRKHAPADPDYTYYAGRSGFDPDGAGPGPAMEYGTDYQIWDNFGLPVSWMNYTAGIGHMVPGELPDAVPAAAGGLPPNDGFMGLQWDLSIPMGAFETIDISTLYGARTGPASDCYADCNCDGALTIQDFGCFQMAYVSGSLTADCNSSGVLTIADFGCFQTKFVTFAGCGATCP